MDNIQKFASDIEKIRKHSSRPYNGEAVCREVQSLFERSFRHAQNLARSYADYWFNTYIASSADAANEPSKDSTDKLVSMYALLENDRTQLSALSPDDYKELCSLTNYEAEDIPLDMLNELMSIFLDNQAF